MHEARAITELLSRLREGHPEAANELMDRMYPELRRLAGRHMRREHAGHILQTTALVHEAYLKVFAGEEVQWKNRAHFLAVLAGQMRRILVDYARAQAASKRGGQRIMVSLEHVQGCSPRVEEDLSALDDALHRLSQLDPRAARVVELRFFGGLKEREVAEVTGASLTTVKEDWAFARAWLFNQLNAG